MEALLIAGAVLLVCTAASSLFVAYAVAMTMWREHRQRRLMARAAADNTTPMRPLKRPKVDRRIQRRRSA